MIIRVKIYASFRYDLPAPDPFTQNEERDMPVRATIAQVLEKLNLPKEMCVTVLLNGHAHDERTILNEGDMVQVLP
jgi:molybdopterin converting factor small subunit